VKQPVPILAALMAAMLIQSPISQAGSLEDWGDWGMDSDRFIILHDENIEHEIEQEHIPARIMEAAPPLDAREQALFSELDNSDLSDYEDTDEGIDEEAMPLLKQLEQLEQSYSAEMMAEEILEYDSGTSRARGDHRFIDGRVHPAMDREQLIALIESRMEDGDLPNELPESFIDGRHPIIDTLMEAGVTVDVMDGELVIEGNFEDSMPTTATEQLEALEEQFEREQDFDTDKRFETEEAFTDDAFETDELTDDVMIDEDGEMMPFDDMDMLDGSDSSFEDGFSNKEDL